MYNVVLIPGDGIGPEVSSAARAVVDATGVKIDWQVIEAGETVMEQYGTPLPQHVIDAIKGTKIALKGPMTTPIGGGFRSVNVALRFALNLYANLRPARTFKGVPSRYEDIDIVVVRENTEDLYTGFENMVGKDAAVSIKSITRAASERIARFAFDYAVQNGRKKVTAVHKANIMKCTDGLFLESFRTVAAAYPTIEATDLIVDNTCMQLVTKPHNFDVMCLPNLYGDIVSDLCAGLVGGLGMAPSGNIGEDGAVFEAVHGSAPKHAGKNTINPIAMILSGAMLLGHLGELEAEARINKAVAAVIAEGKNVTRDLGGEASTTGITEAIIAKL